MLHVKIGKIVQINFKADTSHLRACVCSLVFLYRKGHKMQRDGNTSVTFMVCTSKQPIYQFVKHIRVDKWVRSKTLFFFIFQSEV